MPCLYSFVAVLKKKKKFKNWNMCYQLVKTVALRRWPGMSIDPRFACFKLKEILGLGIGLYLWRSNALNSTWVICRFCITLDICHLHTPYQPLGALQPLCHCVWHHWVAMDIRCEVTHFPVKLETWKKIRKILRQTDWRFGAQLTDDLFEL